MSDSDNGVDSDLIDFSSPSSGPSSGELYEPSTEYDLDDSRSRLNLSFVDEVLERTRVTLIRTETTLGETKRVLRSSNILNQEKDKTIMSKSSDNEKFVSVDQAIKLIPNFDGTSVDGNLAFQNACTFAIRIINPSKMDEFIHGVTTRLTGKAYRAIHYKKPKTYEELKAALNV